MAKIIGNLSIAHKLWIAFGLSLACMIGVSLNILSGVNIIQEKTSRMEKEITPAVTSALKLNRFLEETSSSLGYYLLSHEDRYKTRLNESMRSVEDEITRMESIAFVNEHAESSQLLRGIKENISTLKVVESSLIDTSINDMKNFPAREYAATKQGPLTQKILQNISVIMDAEPAAEKESTRRSIMRTAADLRYSWMNIANNIRAFLAFRSSNSIEEVNIHRAKAEQLLRKLKGFGDGLDFEQEDAVRQLETLGEKYFATLGTLVDMHKGIQWRMDSYMVVNELTPVLQSLNSNISQLVNIQQDAIHSAHEDIAAITLAKKTQSYIVAAFGILMSIGLAWLLSRMISRPLKQAVDVAERISEGDLSSNIVSTSNDETGHLLSAFSIMQKSLKERLTKESESNKDMSRVKSALDSVSAGVMMADADLNIIYMNQSVKDVLRNAETDLQKDLPQFSVDALMGKNIDVFHKNPSHQRTMLERLTSTYSTEIKVGGRTMNLIATPVFDDDGERLGTAVEWADRTAEVRVEDEIETLVNAATMGELDKRLTLDGKTGFFMTLCQGINQLVEVCDHAVVDTVRVLSSLSQGDLTQTIHGSYSGSFGQLKEGANATTSKLIEIIGEIRATAEEVSSAAGEISAGNLNLSHRTESQAASLEETAASMEEMTSTTKQNADNARQANQLSMSARDQAEKGGEVVAQAVEAMSGINKSSKKVADIIGTIDEIAFQTNLLALNAAVEAARAGEQGRGFAVVATEVRNLAQRSAEAAKEIKNLIQDSVQRVEEGTELVDSSGQTLGEIVTAVKKVSDIIAEIAAAGQEQALGIEQVNKAVTQLDDMTQQNAALVEEAAAASESMKGQAVGLNRSVSFFNAGDMDGGYAGANRRGPGRAFSGAGGSSIDFSAAKQKHLSWRTRLRKFLAGDEAMSAEQAMSHKDCDLGKWIYATALDQFGSMPEMQELEKVHQDMHATIKKIVTLKNDGDVMAAQNEYEKIEPASAHVVGLLDDIERHVKADAASASAPAPAAPKRRTAAPRQAVANGNDQEWEEF
ncbi:MAG: methyl-accepting chemotaxis protein [Gammaproteobacteria bacterium]